MGMNGLVPGQLAPFNNSTLGDQDPCNHCGIPISEPKTEQPVLVPASRQGIGNKNRSMESHTEGKWFEGSWPPAPAFSRLGRELGGSTDGFKEPMSRTFITRQNLEP